MTKHTPVSGSLLLAVIVAALIVAGIRLIRSDVGVCREAFAGLAQGRSAAGWRLDWERLQAMGVNVGETYRGLPNAQERRQYRRSFIGQFAGGFARSGATASAFTNWRPAGVRDGKRLVAADYPAKQQTLLFSVSGAWFSRRIGSIQWQS